jgi:phosphonate transport system substrate-binding protein
MCFIVGICIVLSCLPASAADQALKQKRVTIAILPCSDVVMTFKKFHPLAQYLKQQTGYEIKLIVPKDADEFEWAVKNGEIDFVFQDPHTYVQMAASYNKHALLRSFSISGETLQHGLFIVRKDSGITGIEQLKGKSVMFGPKLSAAKWVAATAVLKEKGLNIDKDLKSYQNGGCCEDIAFNVYLKAVDAGVVCDHFIAGHSEKQKELGIKIRDIAVIGKTRAVPTKIFSALKGSDSHRVSQITQALLSLDKKNPAHADILFPAEIGGFQKAKDQDYNDMRSFLGMKH